MSRFLDKAIFVGVLAAVVFTTLTLGAVEAWSVAIFELIAIALLALCSLKAIVDRRISIAAPGIALPLGALVALGLTQCIAFADGSGRVRSLSMDVEATRGAAPVIFFLFVMFIISANVFNGADRLGALANFLVVYGLALAVFALVQHFTWDGRLYWIRRTVSAGAAGPFVNRNHFAGYMEMLIPIPAALALSRAARSEARLFYGFAAVIMGIALVASLSRGGIVSLAAGLLFMAAIMASRNRQRSNESRKSGFVLRPAYLVALMLVAIVLGVMWVGADFDLFNRISNDPFSTAAAADRPAIWSDTLRMFRANPLLGAGLGAFETVYPIYGRADGSLVIQFAHNDYLQILADAGIIGGVLALWFLIAIARDVMRAVKSENPRVRAFALGSASGVFALLVHSLFDFNLQIPSNALLFLLLCAIISRAAFAARDGIETPIDSGVENRERAVQG